MISIVIPFYVYKKTYKYIYGNNNLLVTNIRLLSMLSMSKYTLDFPIFLKLTFTAFFSVFPVFFFFRLTHKNSDNQKKSRLAHGT